MNQKKKKCNEDWSIRRSIAHSTQNPATFHKSVVAMDIFFIFSSFQFLISFLSVFDSITLRDWMSSRGRIFWASTFIRKTIIEIQVIVLKKKYEEQLPIIITTFITTRIVFEQPRVIIYLSHKSWLEAKAGCVSRRERDEREKPCG